MNKMISTLTAALFVAAVCLPGNAAVSASEAKKLGTELTPVGAEPGPNADKTIPAWTGGLPMKAVDGTAYVDPFASDRPLFTITAADVERYKDHLTAGQLELFKKFPGHKMVVYPTRRSAGYSDKVYAALKQNAASAALTDGINGVVNAAISAPFPIPKSGVEVVWNHILHYRGGTINRQTASAVVTAGGNFSIVKIIESFYVTYVQPDRPAALRNMAYYFMQDVLSPPRLVGLVTLVHEPINQVTEPRRAWLYTPGLRRVRKAPFFGYDSPAVTADGLRTLDQYDMYNGSPDRYEWTLVGKKEVYVPYNSYGLYASLENYKTLLQPGLPNPDVLRYELHRVWVVEGRLKKGKDHIFARRTFYVDEDSWQIVAADLYNKRGVLWRVSEAHTIVFYDQPSLWSVADVFLDLPSRRYVMETHPRYDYKADLNEDMFSPAGLRTTGVR